MRLPFSSLTISYHAICVDTHINLFLQRQLRLTTKTLNDDVHIKEYFSNEKYTYICNASFIGRRELVRALLLKETTEFIEQELRFHKRFLIEEFDHGSD